jgi:cell cycle arrest protein BUB3
MLVIVKLNLYALVGSKENFVTGDNEGYAIVWDALSKKKLLEVISASS